MYKLTIDSINQVKYSSTEQHGLFSGTIETDRVVLVDGDGKYLQVDGNFGTTLDIGLVRTYSATRDSAEIAYKIATTNATTYAAVYCYADVMVLQSDYATADAFVEYLVDSLGLITIQDYENPKYQLLSATVTAGGTGYSGETIDVEVPGQAGDTAGVVTVTISDKGVCASAAIKSAGSYEIKVASQVIDVTATLGSGGKITVTMGTPSRGKSTSRPVEPENNPEEPTTTESSGDDAGNTGNTEPSGGDTGGSGSQDPQQDPTVITPEVPGDSTGSGNGAQDPSPNPGDNAGRGVSEEEPKEDETKKELKDEEKSEGSVEVETKEVEVNGTKIEVPAELEPAEESDEEPEESKLEETTEK